MDLESVAEVVVATHGGTVGCACGRSHAVSKVALNSLVQFGEVHRRALLNTSSCSSLGIRVGRGDACGLRVRNSFVLLRDSASAEELRTPGKWRAVRMTLYTAQKKHRVRSSLMSLGSLADPLLMAQTTAELSHQQYTFVPAH